MTLPRGVSRVDDRAFRFYGSLQSVCVPDDMGGVGSYTFSGYASLDGMCFNNDRRA